MLLSVLLFALVNIFCHAVEKKDLTEGLKSVHRIIMKNQLILLSLGSSLPSLSLVDINNEIILHLPD